ncbi:Subtilisin-like protease SBT3.5 [Bienertia sinuspersici]
MSDFYQLQKLIFGQSKYTEHMIGFTNQLYISNARERIRLFCQM